MSFDPQPLKLLESNKINERTFLIERKIRFKDSLLKKYTYQLSPQELEQCLNFSWEMAYGEGHHKATRSGGSDRRNQKKIFENVLTGKAGEIAFYKMCRKRQRCISISEVDFDSYGIGDWDEYDFEVVSSTGSKDSISSPGYNDAGDSSNKIYKVAVKSSQHYANLLLLEIKDWTVEDGKATYRHNEKGKGVYDYIVFCRAQFNEYNPNEPSFFKKYAEQLSQKRDYKIIATAETVKAQVVGYIVNDDLIDLMRANHIIRKNDYMTQREDKKGMRLDADNYYIQAGCLRNF